MLSCRSYKVLDHLNKLICCGSSRYFSWVQFFPSALYRLMSWHNPAYSWCYVALMACPGRSWGQHQASKKRALGAVSPGVHSHKFSSALRLEMQWLCKALYQTLCKPVCGVYTASSAKSCTHVKSFTRLLCQLYARPTYAAKVSGVSLCWLYATAFWYNFISI